MKITDYGIGLYSVRTNHWSSLNLDVPFSYLSHGAHDLFLHGKHVISFSIELDIDPIYIMSPDFYFNLQEQPLRLELKTLNTVRDVCKAALAYEPHKSSQDLRHLIENH